MKSDQFSTLPEITLLTVLLTSLLENHVITLWSVNFAENHLHNIKAMYPLSRREPEKWT